MPAAFRDQTTAICATTAAMLATSTLAQDHAACYPAGAAPEGLREPTFHERFTAQNLTNLYDAFPIYFRRLCGMDVSESRALIETALADAGCSAESPLGREHVRFVDMSLRDLSPFMMGCDIERRAPKVAVEAFCGAYAKYEAEIGEDPGPDDFEPLAGAIRSLLAAGGDSCSRADQ